jgi:hypothetical protein
MLPLTWVVSSKLAIVGNRGQQSVVAQRATRSTEQGGPPHSAGTPGDNRAGGGSPSGVQQNGSPSDGRHAHTPHTRMHTLAQRAEAAQRTASWVRINQTAKEQGDPPRLAGTPTGGSVRHHTGAQFEGQLLNQERGDRSLGADVVDGRESPTRHPLGGAHHQQGGMAIVFAMG